MQQTANDKDINGSTSVFERPTVALLDERQWSYIQKRYSMTPRELQVAILVCRGFSNEEMAKGLKIKLATANTHLRNVYRRAHVDSKISLLLKLVGEAARFYSKSGIAPAVPVVEIQKPFPKRDVAAMGLKKGNMQ